MISLNSLETLDFYVSFSPTDNFMAGSLVVSFVLEVAEGEQYL